MWNGAVITDTMPGRSMNSRMNSRRVSPPAWTFRDRGYQRLGRGRRVGAPREVKARAGSSDVPGSCRFSGVGGLATEGSEIVEIQNAGAERGHDADSVVPTGLDLGATLIPGLKPGAIFFRPFGTQFARDATTCSRSNREEIGHRGLRDHRV